VQCFRHTSILFVFLFLPPWRWQHERPKRRWTFFIKITYINQSSYVGILIYFVYLINSQNIEHTKMYETNRGHVKEGWNIVYHRTAGGFGTVWCWLGCARHCSWSLLGSTDLAITALETLLQCPRLGLPFEQLQVYFSSLLIAWFNSCVFTLSLSFFLIIYPSGNLSCCLSPTATCTQNAPKCPAASPGCVTYFLVSSGRYCLFMWKCWALLVLKLEAPGCHSQGTRPSPLWDFTGFINLGYLAGGIFGRCPVLISPET